MKKNVLFMIDIIIPGLIFGFGIFNLFIGGVFTFGHAFTFVILPLIMTAISVLNCLVVESKFLKFLIFVFMYLPVGFVVLGALLLNSYRFLDSYHDDGLVVKYTEARHSADFLPPLHGVGDTEDMSYYRFEEVTLIFHSEADVLVCEYGEDEYLKEKAEIEKKYVFEDEVQTCDCDYCQYVCYPYAEIDGFTFRRLEDEEGADWSHSYPKQVSVIGMNDETLEIVYIEFSDFDLDYISSFDTFIEQFCGWKYISNEREGIAARFSILVDFLRKITA